MTSDFWERAEKLAKEREALELETRKAGGKSPEAMLEAYSTVKELVSEFREIEAKSKEMDNADLAVRFKFAHKAKKAGKDFWRAVREINSMHEKGRLSEQDAKAFGKVLELLKANKRKEAEDELLKFRKLEHLERGRRELSERLRALEREVESRENALLKLLSEIEAGKINSEEVTKAKRYDEISQVLSQYSSWREAQAEKFKRMQAFRLIRACSEGKLAVLGFPKPRDDFSLGDLGELLSSSGIAASASEVLALSDLKPSELKKHVSDQHQFMRLVSENRDFLSSISSLERTEFLKFDFMNEEKKSAILSAIEASGASSLLAGMRDVSALSHSDYEGLRFAKSRAERSKAASENLGSRDPDEIKKELSFLEGIKSRLEGA